MHWILICPNHRNKDVARRLKLKCVYLDRERPSQKVGPPQVLSMRVYVRPLPFPWTLGKSFWNQIVLVRLASWSHLVCQELWRFWKSNQFHYRPWRVVFSRAFLRKCSQSTIDQRQARRLFVQAGSLGICTREWLLRECMFWLGDRKPLPIRNQLTLREYQKNRQASFMVSNLYGKYDVDVDK